MSQLCAGLGSAHNASIYHRDIKPGNIFVRADGILKILDFGVARLASSSMTAAGFIVGTPDYMSPEQARGENIDGRSDIFSLGGVFYFMLTGRKPFPATELPGLFNQIQNDDPAPLLDTEAPPELAAVIMKALSKKVDARYQILSGSAGRPGSRQTAISARARRARRRAPASAHARVPTDTAGRARRTAGGAGRPRRCRAAPRPTTPSTLCRSAAFNTDDTVTLKPAATWMQRVTDRIDSAVSGAFARVRRPAAPNPPTPTGVRKR